MLVAERASGLRLDGRVPRRVQLAVGPDDRVRVVLLLCARLVRPRRPDPERARWARRDHGSRGRDVVTGAWRRHDDKHGGHEATASGAAHRRTPTARPNRIIFTRAAPVT